MGLTTLKKPKASFDSDTCVTADKARPRQENLTPEPPEPLAPQTWQSRAASSTGRKLPLLLLAIVVANPLFASDDEDKAKAKVKEKTEPKVMGSATVTVTAEATTVEIARTPNPVVVLDLEAISKVGSATLTKALELARPGFFSSYGSFGSRSTFNINGSRSSDTVVLLDGIRISGDPSSLDLSWFTLTGVDRLEVLSGPSSTLYGADAHGGVISMSSSGPAMEGISGYLSLQGSTLGQARTGMTASYGWGDGWLQAAADLDRSPQPTETKKPYRQASGHIGFGQQFGGNTLLTINHRRQYTGAPLPYQWPSDPITWAPLGRVYNYEREYARWQNITTASVKTSFSDNFYAELNLGNINQEGYYTNDAYSSSFKRDQGNALVAWKQGKGGLTLLADYSSEKSWNSDHPDLSLTAKHTAFALEGNIEALPILRFVASVRRQSDEINCDPFGWNSKVDDLSLNQVTWKAGANLLMPSGFRAYLNTGTAFNAPDLWQVAYNQARGYENPGNVSSRSVLAGVGYEQITWWVRADASRINYAELVGFAGDHYINLNDIRVQGLEVSGGARGGNWNAQLYARSQEGRALYNPKESQLSWFQNRPFFSTGVRADWALNQKLELGLNTSYIGHRYTYSDDFGPYPDKTHYIDATVYAVYRWNDALTFTLRGERLFQDGISMEDWENSRDIGRNNTSLMMGYPSMGRALSLEIRYKF
ncbi:MAG: TonB-dependent receptor plug domain-containing protein [Holophagales bacterium]|jgi:outer membrane receptor protein involved in Fe transport|nr:TonB-dependent receptor plug domain-containing protein [Holophagales bacterium]